MEKLYDGNNHYQGPNFPQYLLLISVSLFIWILALKLKFNLNLLCVSMDLLKVQNTSILRERGLGAPANDGCVIQGLTINPR